MVGKAISRTAGRSGLLLKKFSPEILMTVGVVGVVASTVLACRATLKADEVLDDARGKLDKIHYAKEQIQGEAYSDSDYKKDLAVTYVQTGVEFVKLYGPAITLGVASIACILSSHNIMKKRNLALVAAYKAVEQSFSTYRQRVVDEFGAETDYAFKNGITRHKVEVTETDENGNEKTVEKFVDTIDPNQISQYARFFDEYSSEWSKVPDYNLMYVTAQQQHANDLLQARGHVFLNEVYDMLGIPRSSAGCIVGWVKDHGDNYIDFGIFNGDDAKKREFVNGYERSILLDFNVDGVIYDMI